MAELELIPISVKDFIHLTCRSGDLNSTTSYFGRNRALQGIKVHKKIQNKRPSTCLSEVSVSGQIRSFLIRGRIDGLDCQSEDPYIEEIKSFVGTYDDLDEAKQNIDLWQLKLYAFLYLHEKQIDRINIKLTYVQAQSLEEFSNTISVSAAELDDVFYQKAKELENWQILLSDLKSKTRAFLKKAQFPYMTYRNGQREYAVKAYESILDENLTFMQAPTGTGKTMAGLFPTLKAIGEGLIDKIYYLTSKSSGKELIEQALNKFDHNDNPLRWTVITAKQKTCFNPDKSCDPEDCSYAKGHFDRLQECLSDAIQNHRSLHRDCIETLAQKHHICPFELSLDLALLSDVIVCDYNYVFDPLVRLQRHFANEEENRSLLIDEAHNLPERARKMFSAKLKKNDLMTIRKTFKSHKKLFTVFNSINKGFLTLKRELTELKKVEDIRNHYCENFKKTLEHAIFKLPILIDDLPQAEKKDILEYVFEINRFIKLHEYWNDQFRYRVYGQNKDLHVEVLCLNPAIALEDGYSLFKNKLLFSATLTPFHYFLNTLTQSTKPHFYPMPYPFDLEKLNLIIAPYVNTRFHQRKSSLATIKQTIRLTLEKRPGHYFVFFPSYTYMKMALEDFNDLNELTEIYVQEQSLSEQEQCSFLEPFQNPCPGRSKLGVCVLGSYFSEGIDLVGEKLIGVFIIGVGLQAPNIEADLIKNYYGSEGHQMAYQYPAINKVLQAAGRLIRSEHDRGYLILCDDRYTQKNYRKVLPNYWLPSIAKDLDEFSNLIN